MATTSTTKTWDSIATTSLEGWIANELFDQVMLSHPALVWHFGMDQKEFEKFTKPSDLISAQMEGDPEAPSQERTGIKLVEGVQVNVPLRKSRIGTVKWLSSSSDKLGTTIPDPLTTAVFDWSVIGAPVTVSEIDLSQNQGKAKLIDYLGSITDVVITDFVEEFASAYFDVGGSNGQMLGVQSVIDTDPTTGTLGGIDRSDGTNSFWRNQQTDASGGAMTFSDVRTVYNNCSLGAEKPTAMFTDQTSLEKYEDITAGTGAARPISVQHNERLLNLGFDHFMFRNRAFVIDDPACPTNTMYFLTRDALKLVINPHLRMKQFPWTMSEGGLTKTRVVALMTQLVPVEPRRLGVLHNMSN